jgi:CPA1 family monovalent cation:H+ antiporter
LATASTIAACRSGVATNLRELRRDLRPISMLAVGLVVATTIAVAVLAHAALGLPWTVAVVLGAIVAPPDPVAAVAVALAVPTEVAGGGPFPERDLVVFLAFSVIVVTPVGQGLTLPLLVTRLGVVAPDEGQAAAGARALARLSEVALAKLDAIDPDAELAPELLDRLRERYRTRLAHLDRQRDPGEQDDAGAYHELVSELLQVQREELRHLREQGDVTAEVARRLHHDLDVEESRLERERRD